MLCDPRAIGAADLASRRSSYTVDVDRISTPTLLYCGGGDEPEDLEPAGRALGVPVQVVGDGDHWAMFADVEGIVHSSSNTSAARASSPTSSPFDRRAGDDMRTVGTA